MFLTKADPQCPLLRDGFGHVEGVQSEVRSDHPAWEAGEAQVQEGTKPARGKGKGNGLAPWRGQPFLLRAGETTQGGELLVRWVWGG